MKKQALAVAIPIPIEILEILGPPPILSTENEKVYYAILACFAKDIRPTDTVTWFNIKDLADSRVEIERIRRVKAGLINRALKLPSNTAPATPRSPLWRSIAAWRLARTGLTANDPDWDRRLSKECEKDQLKYERQEAEARSAAENDTSGQDLVAVFNNWINEYQQADLLQSYAERRFSSALYDLSHHINGLGRDLRETLERAIEGEIVESSIGPNKFIEGEVTRQTESVLDRRHKQSARGIAAISARGAVGCKRRRTTDRSASKPTGRRQQRSSSR